MFLLAGCQASSLDLGVIFPRDGEIFLANVECYRITATRGGEDFRDVARDLYDLRLEGLPSDRYDLTLEAVERPVDPTTCTGGDVRARAATKSARIDPDRSDRVPLLLLPHDQPVTLDVPAWVEDWFDGRTDLVAATAVDGAGVPRVLFAGGRTADRAPSAGVLLYEPREARFSAMPDLVCARAGAAAVAVGTAGEDERILIAGGDGDCTAAPGPDLAPYTAVATAELLDPRDGSATLTELPAPAPHPRLLRDPRDPAGAWLVAELEDLAIDLHWNGDDWKQNRAPDPLLPRSGGAFTSIFPSGEAPLLAVGGRTRGALLERVLLFEPDYEERRLGSCAIETATVPISGDYVVAAPTANGEVLFAGSAADGGTRWYRQTFLQGSHGCDALAEYETGTLDAARGDPLATPLDDGSVLLSGGDPIGTLELYLPHQGGTLPLGPTDGPRSHHTAVVLEDRSVLLAGGGPRTVEALLPRPGNPGKLGWDHYADDTPELDVIVVVSSHDEARDVRRLLSEGGFFDPESGFQLGAAAPSGLAAATRPLVAEFELTNDAEVRIVVATGDMRCEGGRQGNGGVPRHCSDPNREDTQAEQLTCVLDGIDESEACVAQELLRALEETAVSGELEQGAGEGRPLLVLIAAPRDDCSSATDELFAAQDGTLVERCAIAPDLLDPGEVAELLRAWRGGDPSLISVMTFGGPDVDVVGDPPEACPGIRPTPRLAALSRAMDARGRHVDLCAAGPRTAPEQSSPTALQWWSDLVENRIGRRVCLPHLPATPASCVVTYKEEGEPAIVRLLAGEEGWQIERVPPDTNCSTAILSVSQRLELPIGVPVNYACQ
jgi:hypothetical protein